MTFKNKNIESKNGITKRQSKTGRCQKLKNAYYHIPKANMNKTSVNSYRPTSLNPCISKVLDKILAIRLWWLATNGKLLDNRQTGFRKGILVFDSIAMLDYQIPTSFARKNHTSIVSLDFVKRSTGIA